MIYMLKKRFYILLFFCLLLGGNVNSSTVDKGDNNAPFENKSTETDYLPIADPFVMLYNNKYYAYGTGGTVSEGFACFSSDDLKNCRRFLQMIHMVNGDFGRRRFIIFNQRRNFICFIL